MSEPNFGAAFGANPGGLHVTLNADEIAELDKQAPGTQQDGGWQSLLVGLQEMVDRETGHLFIPAHILTRIQKYAFGYGNGGWEDRLVSAFGRTLGPRLDGRL